MTRPRLPLRRAFRSTANRRALLFGWPVVALFLVACGTGVNDDLISTPTPYPIRSPVVGIATPTALAGAGGDTSFVGTGRELLAAGDAAGAERAFDRALLRAPNDPAALLGRVEARLARGNL